jgi:pimeloyl-ACP methyl ester carboxylesterase
MPNPSTSAYTFDRFSEIIEGLLVETGFTRAGYFMQDYGGPVGFGILVRHPEWAEWLTLQNSNAYEEGFTSAWDGLRHALWIDRGPTPKPRSSRSSSWRVSGWCTSTVTGIPRRSARTTGRWTSASWRGQTPGGSTSTSCTTTAPTFHGTPSGRGSCAIGNRKTVIFWGQHDIFFTPEGGEAYLRDLPAAEIHRLDSRHFAVEDSLEEIASGMREFYDRQMAQERTWTSASSGVTR